MRPKIPWRRQLQDVPVANWKIIYCSFALILVVFFAMMVSYSIVSGKGMTSIRKHFSRGSSLHAPGISMQPLTGIESEQPGDAPAIVLQDAKTRFGLGEMVSVMLESGGIDIIMKDHVLFAGGATEIQKGIYPYLNVIGDVAARNGLHVQVKVRSAVPPGTDMADRSAWDRSALRSVNMMRYFLAYGRLSPDQVSAAGAVASGDATVEPDLNRVELHLSVLQ